MLEDLHHPIKILHAPTLPGPFPSWIFPSGSSLPAFPDQLFLDLPFMDLPFWMSPKRKAQQEGAACDSRRVALSLFDFFKSPLRMNATNILYDCQCHLLIFCPNYIQAPCNSALGKYQLRPFTPPPLPRSLLCPTAHYSALCGRCGSTLERQSRPEVPLAAPGLHRSVHTAHYSALCGRCGSTLERQSRPEVPPAAPGLHRSVHTAHYSALCGRCGSTRESFPLARRYFPVELSSTDGSGFCQKHKPNIAFLRTFADNALDHRALC